MGRYALEVSALHTQSAEVWSDVYGAVHARYTLRAGGHAWLIAAPPELGQATAGAVEALLSRETRLKGSLELLVHDGLLPLESALRGGTYRGVLVIGAQHTSGPALTLEARTLDAPGGLAYQEGGALPGWTAAFKLDDAEQPGESAAASLCAYLSLPVMVCPPPRLADTLLRWAAQVLHGLAP